MKTIQGLSGGLLSYVQILDLAEMLGILKQSTNDKEKDIDTWDVKNNPWLFGSSIYQQKT